MYGEYSKLSFSPIHTSKYEAVDPHTLNQWRHIFPFSILPTMRLHIFSFSPHTQQHPERLGWEIDPHSSLSLSLFHRWYPHMYQIALLVFHRGNLRFYHRCIHSYRRECEYCHHYHSSSASSWSSYDCVCYYALRFKPDSPLHFALQLKAGPAFFSNSASVTRTRFSIISALQPTVGLASFICTTDFFSGLAMPFRVNWSGYFI